MRRLLQDLLTLFDLQVHNIWKTLHLVTLNPLGMKARRILRSFYIQTHANSNVRALSSESSGHKSKKKVRNVQRAEP